MLNAATMVRKMPLSAFIEGPSGCRRGGVVEVTGASCRSDDLETMHEPVGADGLAAAGRSVPKARGCPSGLLREGRKNLPEST